MKALHFVKLISNKKDIRNVVKMACDKKCFTSTTKLALPTDWKLWHNVNLMCAVHCKRNCYRSLNKRCESESDCNRFGGQNRLANIDHFVSFASFYGTQSMWRDCVFKTWIYKSRKWLFVPPWDTSQKKHLRNGENHSESVCIDSCSQRKVSQLCKLANIKDRPYKAQTTQGLTSPLYCLNNRIWRILL